MAYTKYSLTPANNNAAPPNGAPEGMLPSAVNDTMRDMMSQIRDVGDGIRGGTYTMTAPVITGGSITGVALSGNTLTNPVITGGSINNTPIGASTANTGAFTTLSASSTATLNTLVSSGATITGGTISGVSLSATSPNFTTPVLGTPSSGTLTNCTGLPVATGVSGLGANVATFLGTPSSANLATAVSDETGTGSLVFATNPVLVTPNLGTPSAATLTNATGLPVGTGISGLGTGVATFLATPSSANLRTAVTDETGSGALVFATSPTLVTPVLGVATATSVQGIIGNVTPAAGTFTSLTANGNTTLGDAAGDTTTVPDLKALQVTSADRHSVRPSLLLDFANTKTLDPRITYTRASTGTFYDGKTVAKAEENLLLWSQDVTNATWTKSAITASISGAAPDGTSTANLLIPTTASAIHRVNNLSGSTVNGTQYTYSVYAKASGYEFLYINGIFTAGQVCFNLTTGAVAATSAGTGSITSVGNGWYRCVVTATANGSASGSATLQVNNSGVATDTTFAGDGTSGILIWGAQLEQRSSVTAYTATTTAPITNYIPALQTAAAGVARFEHNSVTGESLGLEIEEQRTNLLSYSDDYSNAYWTKRNSTITSNTIVAPDGTLTGDKLVEDTSNNQHTFGRGFAAGISITSAQVVSLSIYAKAGERSTLYAEARGSTDNNGFLAYFNLSAGTVASSSAFGSGTLSSATITAVGNGWYRCVVTGQCSTATAVRPEFIVCNTTSNNSYTGDGFSGVYLWGAQLEAGAFATSYIPTVASQVTRSADAASMTGTNFSSWFNQAEGTIYTEVQYLSANGSGGNNMTAVALSDNSVSNRIRITTSGSAAFEGASGGTIQFGIGVPQTIGTFGKNVGAYKVNDFAVSVNGGTVVTDTSGSVPLVTQMQIGNLITTRELTGNIKKIAYYPRRLTNAELVSLSTV